MSLLHEIIEHQKEVVQQKKRIITTAKIRQSAETKKPSVPFLQSIFQSNQLSIIAEMKKKSPSAGLFMDDYRPESIAKLYEASGASALSVLTEEKYFSGNVEHIQFAQKNCNLPILRKDFIVDPYQIYEAKVFGASAVLLIIAALPHDLYADLLKLVYEIQLDALVEVHSEKELETALKYSPKVIGINNRNLADLTISLNITNQLVYKIPKGVCIVSESGIQTPETIRQLKERGVHAALIGESLLKKYPDMQLLKSFVQAGRS